MAKRSQALGKLIFDADKPGSPKSIPVWRIEAKTRKGWKGPYRTEPRDFPGCRDNLTVENPKTNQKRAPNCEPYNKVQRALEKCAGGTTGKGLNRPIPEKDFFPREWWANPDSSGDQLFGFDSPKAAEEWFGKACLTSLAKAGFPLHEVKARKVWLSKSKKQVIFFREDDRDPNPIRPLTASEKARLRRELKKRGKL